MADTPGGLGAILTQVDKDRNFYAISFASQQLKDHEKNYSPFFLEAAAAVWGMDFFNEYLKGKRFILYTDHKPLEETWSPAQSDLQTPRGQRNHRQHFHFQPISSGPLQSPDAS
jgi:hypothetical protein